MFAAFRVKNESNKAEVVVVDGRLDEAGAAAFFQK